MAEGIYHFGMIAYKLLVLREPAYLLPKFKDLTDMLGVMGYNLGLKKEHPEMNYGISDSPVYR